MNNKKNLVYFEGKTMNELYTLLDKWQELHQKRLLSLNIQKENDTFTCIALTNPTEVILCDYNGRTLAIGRTSTDYEPILCVMPTR